MKTGQSYRLKKLMVRDAVVLVIGVLYAVFIKITGIMIPCVFRKVTGYRCPGCGITGSIMAVLEGHIKTAFGYNPFLWVIGPVILYLLIKGDVRYVKDNTYELNKADTIVTYICLVFAVVFWFVRNI
jgi:hypothetical protein